MVVNEEATVQLPTTITEEAPAPTPLPCIFDAKVKNPCPVRTLVQTQAKLPSAIEAKGLGPLGELQAMMENLTGAMQHSYGTLASFCQCCPFLTQYALKES